MITHSAVKGVLLAVTISFVILTALLTVPAASALTQRNNFDDSHHTSLNLGGPKICGDHLCGPGEYQKMIKHLNDAQLGK